ncbi:DUF1460 domain-containing protein [Rhodocytophaga rosea]|uniref:DUF1460 domain-containing protein n=1 Tax=Rhodocytophaga rosea TaxID=2704465 RepID=A0A6C0GIE8_9BACT|nr:N-acetylmuramoyl-L-alanine amidase-like domain-containing protein [Rhodocytophaga rosea]QHT67452.1 DUF1460 domain-containing protein [Rhodocytophaga rosea]
MKSILYLVCFLSFSNLANSQIAYSPQDVAKWKQAFQSFHTQTDLPFAQLVVQTGKTWIGTPYVAHTLDKQPTEQLVVNLKELDCTTYVESMLAMGMALKEKDSSFQNYTNHLQQIRYRNGEVNGYGSRLHYFSDWLYENEKQGNLKVITDQLGGKPVPKPINFMSTHRAAYPALKSDEYFTQISQIEKEINTRTLLYIPKSEVSKIESKLKEGDIIAITTSIKGLDVVHVGFAVVQDKRIHLLHASLDEKKVVISKKPLAEYLLGNKNQAGIMVARVTQ